ncbi:MAG: nucleotide exchange factor GrpE [Myxococcota bacterium]|nr:nucleotide exchange factor GrpE [Myxococcota bacterium]
MGNKKEEDMDTGNETSAATPEAPEVVELTSEAEVELLESPEEEWVNPLQEVVVDTEARLKTVSAAYVRLQKEMTEMKERVERQRAVEKGLMKGDVVRSLFEPLQNLRRSVGAFGGADVDPHLVNGLDMVVREFMSAFEGLGLEEVPGVGSRFDPELHEALTVMPVADPELDGKIVEVFSAGYRIGKSLLAPAKVVIGKFEEPVGDA